MTDNLSEKKTASICKNIHNFSWFPSILLIFQLFLLLFGLFKFNHEIVDGFNQFLQESSFFIGMINGLLILWYWTKGTILNRTDISKEFKIMNSCICVINIVLLNKLYNNNKITEVFSSVKAFFSSENIAKYVFVLVIIGAIFIIVRYARNAFKNTLPDEIQPANSANNSMPIDNDQPSSFSNRNTITGNVQSQQMSTTQVSSRAKDVRVNVLFFVIFVFLVLIIVAVVYILIAKYNMVINIINNTDKSSIIFSYLLLVIFAIASIILSFIIVTAIARSISKLIFQIPEYIRRAEVPDGRIIKIAVGIVLIPVFYGITKLFGISTDWVLNLLQSQDFLVVPFIILLYFVLSMLFVEVVYGLFSGKPRTKWLKSFTEMISDTGDNVVNICSSIVKNFFRLLQFIPDFLEAIQTVLMGEEDETGNMQSKQNSQNDQDDSNN